MSGGHVKGYINADLPIFDTKLGKDGKLLQIKVEVFKGLYVVLSDSMQRDGYWGKEQYPPY